MDLGRSPGNDTEAQLADRPFWPGSSPGRAVVRAALRGPLMRLMCGQQRSDLLSDHEIRGTPRRTCVVDDQIDASGALRIPAIGLEMDSGLHFCLLQSSSSIGREPWTLQRRE